MIPGKVRIGGLEYDVKMIDELLNDHDCAGQIVFPVGVIKLDSRLSEDRKEQTLVHEILHGIFEEAGYEEQDEDMVNRLGKVLYQVLKDNELNFNLRRE